MRTKYFAVVALLLASIPAQASERYYATFFAYQDEEATPELSHTFACFVKATFDSPSRLVAVDSITISWLPASGKIELAGPPVAGKNFSLAETLAIADRDGLQVSTYGPFEVKKEVFDLAARQAERLRNGAVAFRSIDTRFRPNTAINCIHAVSDLLSAPLLYTGDQRGASATQKVVKHFQPFMVEPEQTHPWVATYLGRSERFDDAPQPVSAVVSRK